MKALTTRKRAKTLKVRKNGHKAIDAASTMKLPTSYSRILRSQVTTRWTLPSVAAFTPNSIEMILRAAADGNYVQQWEMFDMMLRNWPTLGACQQELLYGIERRELVFDPFSQEDELATPSAIEREKLVTCAIRNMNPDPTRPGDNGLRGTIKDIMDAWFRGISVMEIIWQMVNDKDQGQIITPQATTWAHPSCYAFSDQGVLGLTDENGYPPGYSTSPYAPRSAVLRQIPPNKFLIAMHKVKSGTPFTGALLTPLAWWWCAANFSSDWLLNLAQLFGLPFRWASYAASSPDQTISAICDMLQNMGSAGWAAFPEGTTLELKEATGQGGASPQGHLLDRADGYARSLILGQTLTGQTIASGRGGQAFGTVEAQLKQDRLDAASSFVAEVINQQLIPAILMQNYGNTDEAPVCRFLQETEGTYQDAQRDQIIAALGLPIPFTHLQQKYNIPEPTGGEEVTKPPPTPKAPSDVSAGPAGTRPIGQTPNGSSPKPRQVEAKLQEISLIEDDELFARELRKLASELVTEKGETNAQN